jgi:high-affinity iron transporter
MLNSTFFEAAAILLREGLEAILVLAAIGAYMTRMGAENRLSALYGGAGAAVVASVAMAWGLAAFNNGVHNDLVEGFVMLLAAALMFYVSGWLFLKQDPRAWQAYLKEHTDKVVDGGTLMATAVLAFLAVFREGAETVLFLHALANTSGGWSSGLIAGLIAAGAGLCAIFWVVTKATKRLPLRPVFLVTSAFMFVMGLRFVGAGLQEFQEQALIGFHPIPWSDWLIALGLNASWEAVATQLAVLVVAGASVVAMLRTRDGATG